jgi:hypothetical protein
MLLDKSQMIKMDRKTCKTEDRLTNSFERWISDIPLKEKSKLVVHE